MILLAKKVFDEGLLDSNEVQEAIPGKRLPLFGLAITFANDGIFILYLCKFVRYLLLSI